MNASRLFRVALLSLTAPLLHAGDEVGFVEKFALAPEREAVLTQLIPGSAEFYYFHALHYQNTRQTEKLATLLAAWAKRFPRSEQREEIENREALLTYAQKPQETLRFLRQRLNLQFNHEPEAPNRKPDLPTALDPGRVKREVFQKDALRRSDDLQDCTLAALERLVREKVKLKPEQTRALLARLERPDVPNLVEVVLAELRSTESRGFGEFPIHRALLPEQLDELAARWPALLESQAFVTARLRKMAPGADTDVEVDLNERQAWLERTYAYASRLAPAFNSLKASLLYRRLELDRRRGVYEASRLREYLKLPRRAGYVRPLPRPVEDPIDFQADFAEAVPIAPPIGSDEELVRDYFLHLFAATQEGTPQEPETLLKPWTDLMRDSWLKPVLAEAMITTGRGEPERWASLLTPAAFKALKDRVEVDLVRTNPAYLRPEEEVTLELEVKNASRLMVKVYEINTLSYYLTHDQQLNTDLPLDGLVANQERTEDFSKEPQGDNPFRRVRRTFAFPELKGKRGAWMVEFIGNGKSSRALVRKGQWSLLQQDGPAGQLLTVLDENGKPVRDAVVWLEGRRFAAEEKTGRIPVPATQAPGSKPVVLAEAAGGFASLATLEHRMESYELEAQFFLPREQLLARQQATLAVRATLLGGTAALPPELLKEARLRLVATSLDGTVTNTETEVKGLERDREWLHPFRVPERLASLEAVLTAKVENLSRGGEKQEVRASRTWRLNEMDRTTETSLGQLTPTPEGYLYELLGRNGEPVAERAVDFQGWHTDFLQPVYFSLKTDERGRIALGKLPGLSRVQARPEGRPERLWELCTWQARWPAAVHALAGETIRLPLPPEGNAPGEPGRFSLLEQRSGTVVADLRALCTQEGGSLVISHLPAGDYTLRVQEREPQEVLLRVTAGEASAPGWLVSPNRRLEQPRGRALAIASVQAEAEGLRVQLAEWNPGTRVHVVGTRFQGEETLFTLGQFRQAAPGWATPDRQPSLYAAGRAIGDEYRYILERRFAHLFPGNLLARPGLLLAPWETRSTDLQAQSMAPRQQAGRTAGGSRGRSLESRLEQTDKKPGEGSAGERMADLDFLAKGAPAVFNLQPDAQGVVRVERAALGDRAVVQILAEDRHHAVWQQVALGAPAAAYREVRLRNPLDPAKAYAEKKEVTLLRGGETLTVADLLTSELATYDTLPAAFNLLRALSPHPEELERFEWLMRWPSLSAEEKQRRYSDYASHEVNFFLARRDPEFFRRVIAPHLRNKKDPTFVDDFLLERDLARSLEPWAYARLNALERALLGQRRPQEKAAAARHLRERWELNPPNPREEDRLFQTALGGQSLTRGEAAARADDLQVSYGFMAPATPGASPAPPPAPSAPVSFAGSVAVNAGKLGMRAMADQNAAPLPAEPAPGRPAAGEKAKRLKEEGADRRIEADNLPRENAAAEISLDEAQTLRSATRPFYRSLGPTKEWAENNYYRVLIAQQTEGLIPVNAFWRDYAEWDGQAPFLSKNLAEATHSGAEMLMALAVLDLPFTAGEAKHGGEGATYTFTPAGPTLAYARQIRATAPAARSELLVSQNFFRQSQPYRQEGNERFDLYVTKEFLVGEVYGGSVVVTNPTSSPQKLEVLLQVPQGSIPVQGSRATESKRITLAPYTTQKYEYFFYFPQPSPEGKPFGHLPVQVSRQEQSVGRAEPFRFTVVRQLSEVDTASWDYVSQYGSEEQVFAFLEQHNVERLPLERVAWRARRSADFFHRVMALLAQRHRYNEVLASYAVVHNDAAELREWLRHQEEFVHQCGPALESSLLVIDPIERRTYQHLEYAPLVNQRVHRLGAEARIANPVFRGQYQELLRTLAHRPALQPMDELSVVYYLFLQDRVEEALARFHALKPESLPTRLQYDYLRAYAAFYEERPEEAQRIAQAYAPYPVERWQKLFAEVLSQAKEIAGEKAERPKRGTEELPEREGQQAELASTEPTFDFQVENKAISLTWQNLAEVTINYYRMEPEFLFSSSPFVTEGSERFSIIKPTRSDRQKLEAGQDTLVVPLPPELNRANVLIEILGAGQRRAQAYHANAFKLNLAENYGRVEVREQAEGKVVPKAYVKVYARLRNGTVRFFKDGYTDLRGRFDYASLNSSEMHTMEAAAPARGDGGEGLGHEMLRPSELGEVERLAILILDEAHGAAVREVAPPAGGTGQ